MRSWMKLDKSKTLTIVSVVMVLCFAFGLVIALYQSHSRNNREYFSEIAYDSTSSIQNSIYGRIGILKTVSRNFADIDWQDADSVTETLRQYNSIGLFTDLLLVDTSNSVFSANDERYYLKQNDLYLSRSFLGDSIIISPENYSADVNENFLFCVPVFDNSDIIAVLCGTVLPQSLQKHLDVNLFNSDIIHIIIDSAGNSIVVGTNNELEIGSNFNLFADTEITKYDESNLLKNLSFRNENGILNFKWHQTNYFMSYNSMDNADWYICSIIEEDNLLFLSDSNIFIFSMIIVIFALAFSFLYIVQGVKVIKIDSTIKQYKEENYNLLYVDQLTKFNSRLKFDEIVDDLLKVSPSESKYAMISMDINKFRAVNDLLGHDDGNRVLIKLADIINRNIFTGETFARVSADSFLMLIRYESDKDITDRIENLINDGYYQIDEFRLIMAFGIYKVVDRMMDLRAIIDRADLARRAVKNQNESSYAFFDSFMLSKIREEKAIENVMEQALDSKEFVVYLQPKYDLQGDEGIIGAEALVRWRRDGKMIPPGNFIPLFEKNGFITKLDSFVFEEVCKQQKMWMARGYQMRLISVNMSRVNLQKPNFVKNLNDVCQRYNVPTKYFEIEITESVAFENLTVLTEVFSELKSYGFTVSIDDFGSGYSSLNMLKDLPVDVIKIDRAFLTDSDRNARACDIIDHVISLAVCLGINTICEGIETKEQVDLLVRLGCNMAQGFYFARPMPISEFEDLLYSEKEKI